ncbi:MAG: hypothetical protein ACKVQA_07510, partial [Burkholderiales bacterium]
FSISYHAVCATGKQEIAFDIEIEGSASGSLDFRGTATPKTDFLTARTGFVVLHPLTGTVDHAVELEHTDGSIENSAFPEIINPVQPFFHLRAMTHEIFPGVKATVRFEGDTWETEDHRNWTDASFKTYVRPLALPWPYVLKAGEVVKQSVKVTLSGNVPKAKKAGGAQAVEIKLGAASKESVAPVGLGVPAEEISHTIQRLDLLKLAAPKLIIGQIDPRKHDGLKELYGYRVLCELTGAQMMLEAIVGSLDRFAEELKGLVEKIRQSGITLAAVAVVPVGDLKSVLPGGPRPPAPALDDLYKAARAAFPGVKLGGGMFSFFTELNRKRVPVKQLDFVTNTTCPTVHAADDRSVMETLEALPHQIKTARTFIGKTPHRIGPSAIGCRDNPHGATYTPNPKNERVCLPLVDPRMRAQFGAAWIAGYIATLARTGVESVAIGASTGPLGIIYRKGEHTQPYFDEAKEARVFPSFHVISGLTRAAGRKIVTCTSTDFSKVQCLAYKEKKGTLVWLINLTADEQTVTLSGHGTGAKFIGLLDETSFAQATTDPRGFQSRCKPLEGNTVKLKAYAVAFVSVND